MIADRLNKRKMDKYEAELDKLFQKTPINFSDPEYTTHPELILIEEKVSKSDQKIFSDFFNYFNNDFDLDVLNNLKLINIVFEYYRLKDFFEENSNSGTIPENYLIFFKEITDCKSNPSNEKVEQIYDKYKRHFQNRFGVIESSEFYKIIKKGKELLEPVLNDLRQKVEYDKMFFIKSVNFSLLENKFLLYYFLDYYRDDFQPIFQEIYSELILELEALHPDSLSKLDLNSLAKYKTFFQEQKDKLAPPTLSKKLGVEQNDLLKLFSKFFELFNLLSFDFLFEDIKDLFEFRYYSRIRFASVLYDFFLVTHRFHPVYEFYTEEEWWDEQDNKGNLPSNRKWKNHKLLRVKNIIPDF